MYSRLAGYEDTNDAERLAQDPTMRIIVGRRGGPERPAASTNTMSRFETEVLTQDGNVEGLGRVNAKWVDRAMTHTAHRRVILDMDSSESPVHGEQEGASYNGHFGSTCYHPLFVFNQFGDCEGAMLRAGNVHSAHRWRDVLDPILSRYGATGVRRYFRADAAFAKPDIYEYLEERHVLYAIRLPGNEVLQREIVPLLRRPVGRPPKRPVILYDDFWYCAGSWERARRVVAKVEWHRGELFPRVGFIVTNMTAGPEGVVRFYNGRGTAEQWIKEGKYALNWTRLSCHRFVANRVRLSLFVLAYNLGNFLRRLCLPKAVKHWSLRSVPRCCARVAGRSRPALATRRWSSKTTRIRSGLFCGSIYWVLLVSGRVSVSKPFSQIQRSTLWLLQGLSPKSSFGGFGLTDVPYWTRSGYKGGLSASMYFFAVSRWMPTSRATPRIDSPLRFAFCTAFHLAV